MNINYLIGIDPAGIGATGIVVWSIKKGLIDNCDTIVSKSVDESIFQIKKIFDNFQKIENFKPLFIIENFFLTKGRTITNPLATSELIGAIKSILKFHYGWNFIKQEPSKKKGFSYKGNLKLTKHEHDAWKHIQYFLNERNKEEWVTLKKIIF